MSFLKRNWRLTVPAFVALCALLIGVIVLYSTGEPPEPKTVYVMPERTADNPPPINTGGIVPSTELIGTTESPTTEVASAAENLETCCPEEETTLQDSPSAQNANLARTLRDPSPEALAEMADEAKRVEFVKRRAEWREADNGYEKIELELRQNWMQLIDEQRELTSVIDTGELDTLTVPEIKELRAQHKENRRKIKSAWKELEEWRRNRPAEPTRS